VSCHTRRPGALQVLGTDRQPQVPEDLSHDVGIGQKREHDHRHTLRRRRAAGATRIATQLPVTAWHGRIGDATLADAICDRLVHRAHKITT